MNVFYNREGIGDTLLVTLTTEEVSNKSFEKKGDVVRIFNEENEKTVGFNIFQASNYFKLENANGHVELNEELVNDLNRVIAHYGFEEKIEADFSPKFVVGYVKEKVKHPNADKLSVCQVDIGDDVLQIVCGAPNVDAGQKVVVAKIGAVMPSGLVIKPSELRGVSSEGMLCSARELELPNAPQEKGILVLEETYEVGSEFKF